VSNEDDWPPFDFSVDSQPKGYSVELIRYLSKKIGLKVEFVNGYTWSELIDLFDNKKIDMMHVMTKNKERAQRYSFSKPYMFWRWSYFIRKSEQNINSPKDFYGKKIGSGKGWYITKLLKKIYPDSEIVEYKNSLKIIEALSHSEIDIAVDNMFTVNYLSTQNYISNIKEGGLINFNDENNNFYFVSHKDEPQLASIFYKAYEKLTLQERVDLQEKWFLDPKNSRVHLSTDEKNYLKKKKVIKMCIDPDWMPFEKFDKNGNYTGITKEYFDMFKEDLGIEIQTQRTKTWSESLEYAKSRKCDILSLAMETPERKKYLNFTSPYLNLPLALATGMNVSFINDLKYLNGEKIGMVKDYALNELIRTKYPNIKVVDVENMQEGLQKVVDRELFGYIDAMNSVGYMLQTKFVGKLKITGKFQEQWRLGIGVRNDDPILLNIFEKEIKNVSDDTKQRILSKYISIRYDKNMDYSLLIKILLGVGVFMAVVIYHNRKLKHMNEQLQFLQQELREQAYRDPMTNLYNRRYFHNMAGELMAVSQREKRDMGVIVLDIDNFKLVNDTYGHDMGDEVIKQLADILINNTRKSDIAARFGGEEFSILLPSTDLEGTLEIAEKLRSTIQKSSIIVDEERTISYTVSVGVDRVLEDDKYIDAALNRADKALYKAKNSGKNQVQSMAT
jgi:polar amino acid transport system substrate-binding protein